MLSTESTVHVRVKKTFPTQNILPQYRQPGVLCGSRYYTHADGPFEVEKIVAERMLKTGLVDVVTRVPGTGDTAADPKAGAQRR
jgi:hypothetical protein